MELTLEAILKKAVFAGKEADFPVLQILLETEPTRAVCALMMHTGQPIRVRLETLQATLEDVLAKEAGA